ncbi:hypothetical protein NYE25_02555 [Paenibacillus sp. FSL E2-8871]
MFKRIKSSELITLSIFIFITLMCWVKVATIEKEGFIWFQDTSEAVISRL